MSNYCSECGQALPKKIKDTHIVFIMDMSGSMMTQAVEAIGAFNAFIEEQRKVEDLTGYVTLICFDNVLETAYAHLELSEVPTLTSDVYAPRGMTALYDAIGHAIWTYKPRDTEKVIYVVVTDGYENASKEVRTSDEIKKIIADAREAGSEIIFLAADEEVLAQASAMGIHAANTMSWSGQGYAATVAQTSRNMTSYRVSTDTTTTAFFDEGL